MSLTDERRVRVLAVDDHPVVRAGLLPRLEEEGFDVVVVASAEAALRGIRSLAADVVILPGGSGIEATRRLVREAPATSVLTLVRAGDRGHILEAVRAGSSGYLLADATLEDIVAGVRAVAAGHVAIDPRVAGALVAEVRASGAAAARELGPRPVDLSPRELELLALVTRGLRNVEIGRQLYLSSSAVKNELTRLFEKVGAENRVQAAAYAVRHGLVHDAARAAA